MNRKQKKNLIRIIIAAVLLIFLKLVSLPAWLSVVLYLAAYIVIGYDILRKAFKGILNKQVFDENFLMAVATVGAIALAVYERSADLSEAVAVMLFYQIGELFQSYAVGKSRRNISALMDIRPDYANIEKETASLSASIRTRLRSAASSSSNPVRRFLLTVPSLKAPPASTPAP